MINILNLIESHSRHITLKNIFYLFINQEDRRWTRRRLKKLEQEAKKLKTNKGYDCEQNFLFKCIYHGSVFNVLLLCKLMNKKINKLIKKN